MAFSIFNKKGEPPPKGPAGKPAPAKPLGARPVPAKPEPEVLSNKIDQIEAENDFVLLVADAGALALFTIIGTQKGLAYTVVKNVETAICPFCQAYERVHGKKAHEKNS